MVRLSELVAYTNYLLAIENFSDYCPNGLQVEGRGEVRSIIGGVTACQALLDAAVAQKADAVLVHHGYFWKGENPCIVGMKQRRLATLLQNQMSLIAYHLPLDAHPEVGNNAQLARVLKLTVTGTVGGSQRTSGLVMIGELPNPMSGAAFSAHITGCLRRQPLHIPGNARPIQRLAWCTGGAQHFIEIALNAGVDAFLTGEASEQTVHFAHENGLHFFAAGHHATERYGIPALGAHLTAQFPALRFDFIEIENPV